MLDHLAQHLRDLIGGARLGGKQLLLHLAGGALDEFEKMLVRDVGPQPELLGEHVVAGRALDQHAEAGVGEARAVVLRHRADHLPVAAHDQHVGHRFAQARPPADGEQVARALGLRIADEVALGERRRMPEHRLGHLDVVVEGERAHHARRRIGKPGEPACEFRPRPHFDFRGEPSDHVVEQGDLFLAEARGPVEEKVGDARQGRGALLGRAGGDGLFQVVNERTVADHSAPATTAGAVRSRRDPMTSDGQG
jgi:hypothetical protein